MNIEFKSTRQNGGHGRRTFWRSRGLPLAAGALVGLMVFITVSHSSSVPFRVWVGNIG